MKTWQILIIAIPASIMAAMIFAAIAGQGRPASAPQPRGTTRPVTRAAPVRAGISYADFNRVQPGMTYGQVAAIFGEGQEISRFHMQGVPGVMESISTVMYSWKGGSIMSSVNATFQNDRLISKAQFGLK